MREGGKPIDGAMAFFSGGYRKSLHHAHGVLWHAILLIGSIAPGAPLNTFRNTRVGRLLVSFNGYV